MSGDYRRGERDVGQAGDWGEERVVEGEREKQKTEHRVRGDLGEGVEDEALRPQRARVQDDIEFVV
jgi:hypothetical protein